MIKRIGQYEVLEEVGSGGMGVVYRGIDVLLDREVAIKRLRPELAADPRLIARFRNEAQTQARLSHPNINHLYALLQEGDALYIVMEFVRGSELTRYIPAPWQNASRIAIQVLAGIDYAHQRGVMHRDIKPDNIILDCEGTVKVMDFGIAHTLGTARMTAHNGIVGTLEYMAPERVLGQEADQRSDIYSIGVLLFQLLSGQLPFRGTNEYELLRAQIELPAPPVTNSAPGTPAFLVAIIDKALCKKPEQRYSSCAEMAAALRDGCRAAGLSVETSERIRFEAPATQEERTTVERWRKRIDSMIAAGNVDVAQRLLETALNDMPRNPELLACQQKLEILSAAAPTMIGSECPPVQPAEPASVANRGDRLRCILTEAVAEEKSGRPDRALQIVQEALRELPNTPALLIAAGCLKGKSGGVPI